MVKFIVSYGYYVFILDYEKKKFCFNVGLQFIQNISK